MTRLLSRIGGAALAWGVLTAAGCSDKPASPASPSRVASDDAPSSKAAAPSPSPAAAASEPAPGPAGCTLSKVPTRVAAPERVVAIGDLHGDMAATKAALRAGGLIDTDGRWTGGKTVLVQTGDQLDRGDDEQEILDMLERLRGEAAKAGGAVLVLNGNHETMNAAGDFRYVTAGGWVDFADVEVKADDQRLAAVPAARRGRVSAFLPGGRYAKVLADHNTVVVVGDTVFVHGGVTPAFARYGLARLNREIRCWLSGQSPAPGLLRDASSPLWSRHYSAAPEQCKMLDETLTILGAKRMVVGHTPQVSKGANAACDERVWRVDTGLAAHYGGPIEVLEIRGDKTRVLRAARP